MKNITLDDSLLIGKGSGRACYTHPDDDQKIIKVNHSKRGVDNNQNFIDYKYINHLRKKKKSLIHIASCYEYVETSLGLGLIFDKVVDYNNEASKSFRYFMAKKIISLEKQRELLDELQTYLETEDIVFVDNCVRNFLCQEVTKDEYRLIIIDGVGAKREGVKFWMYLNIPLYRKYKIKKQWTRLLEAYNKDLKRIEENINPITRF